MSTAKLKPIETLVIEKDNFKREFVFDSQWNGFIKLVSNCPMSYVIIKHPKRPSNPWDMFHEIFGGNKSFFGIEVEIEIIETNIKELERQDILGNDNIFNPIAPIDEDAEKLHKHLDEEMKRRS